MSILETKRELAPVVMQPGSGLQITTIEGLQRAASVFVESGLFGDNQQDQKTNLARSCIKIMAGSEIGLTPFFATKNIYIIDKAVTYSYQLVALLIKRSGKYKFKVKQRDDNSCTLEFYELENGKWDLVDTVKYGEEDAKREGVFTKTTRDGRSFATGYQKHPTVMYFSRALTRGANMHCADLFGGSVYTPADFHVAQDEIQSAKSPVPNSEGITVDAVVEETTAGSDEVRTPENNGQEVVAAEEDRPGAEQIAQIFKHATACGWNKEQLEAWFEPFLESRGVDISTTEKLFETWTWKDVTSAIDYLTANKPEAK